jgi:hypothetical protein
MAWNHRTRVVAMAVVAQVSAGTFIQPNTTTHLLPVANPTNTVETVSADDPTATGAIWDANRIYLGKTATLGGSIPLRGPGGAAPPTAGTWTPGVILSSGRLCRTAQSHRAHRGNGGRVDHHATRAGGV